MNPSQQYHTFMDFQYQPKGVVVPQPVYKATAQFNALPTICFVEGNTLGVNLGNALRKQVTNLANKDSRPKISETAKKVTIRINWPGYESWSTVVHIVDHSYEGRPTTLGKLAHDIAKVINELKKDMAAVRSTAPDWNVNRVNLDNLLLLELRHVSAGSWQPVFSLDL